MDDADRAQINEERERRNALANALVYDQGEPVVRAGVRWCVDCDEPISAERLAAWPQAVRCASCQQEHELKQGRYAD